MGGETDWKGRRGENRNQGGILRQPKTQHCGTGRGMIIRERTASYALKGIIPSIPFCRFEYMIGFCLQVHNVAELHKSPLLEELQLFGVVFQRHGMPAVGYRICGIVAEKNELKMPVFRLNEWLCFGKGL